MVKPETLEKVVEKTELVKHNTEKDCWVAIGGVVYDLTKFLPEHPGGAEIVLPTAGGDGTESFEEIGHSKAARKMGAKYEVGVLEGHEGPVIGCEKQTPATTRPTQETPSPALWYGGFVVAVVLMILAYIWQHRN